MDQGKRIGLTSQQHRELWERWKAGESLGDIGEHWAGSGREAVHDRQRQRHGADFPCDPRLARRVPGRVALHRAWETYTERILQRPSA